MSFTDKARANMEIEPRETREEFILRYAGMRPVAENMTLAIALASSLGNPQREQEMLWGGTLYQMHHAIGLAMSFVTGKTDP